MMYGKRLFLVCAFILADILTGLIKAFSSEGYASSVMRQGLWHKLSEIVSVLFCILCDQTLPSLNILLPFHLVDAVTGYIILMESGSVIENIGITNPEIGKYLTGIFEKIQVPDPEEYEKEEAADEDEE